MHCKRCSPLWLTHVEAVLLDRVAPILWHSFFAFVFEWAVYDPDSDPWIEACGRSRTGGLLRQRADEMGIQDDERRVIHRRLISI